jgi:phosphoenolpyruvate synthase/pyruvate phosphate dikinase
MDIEEIERRLKEFRATLKPLSECTPEEIAEVKAKVKQEKTEKAARRASWPEIQKHKGQMILKGKGVSPGLAMGRAINVLKHVPELMVQIEPGDIIVAENLRPEHDVFMKKAAGYVTDVSGWGLTSPVALVAREWAKPAVVGTMGEGEVATEVLKTGQWVVVDGTEGVVYEYRDNK